ncbi:MAG: ATP-binding protein [bacterium]
MTSPALVPAPGNPVPPRWRRQAAPSPPLPLPGVGRALVSLREVELKGREEERDALWRALRRVAERGRPAAVLLEGPSGYGKSRLAAWLSRRAHELGVAETITARHGRQTGPTCGLAPMLARALRTEGLAGDDVLVRIADAMGNPEADDDAALVPALAALVGGIGSFSGASERLVLGSEAERHATLRRGLGRLAGGRPLVIAMDDLQWGLEAIRFTQSLLEGERRAAGAGGGDRPRRRARARLARGGGPGGAAGAASGPHGPGRPPRGRHPRRHLPVHAAPRGRHGGSPRGARRGQPALRRGAHPALDPHGVAGEHPDRVPTAGGRRGDVPGAVSTLWQARISEVIGADAEARSACELAAALGPIVDPAEWEATCAMAGVAPRPDLHERLQAAGLLVRETAEGPLRFAHVMAREALRQSARDGGRWARWNAVCATFLGPSGDVERQAHHLLAARRLDEALGPLDAAARRHLERAEPLRARRLILARARALRALGIERGAPAWIETRVAWAEQAAASGDVGGALRHGRRALAEARPAHLPCLVGRALIVLGRMTRQLGDAGAGLAALEEALQVAELRADCHLLTAARLETLWSLVKGGRLAEADALARRVLTTKEPVEPSQLAEARYAVATLAWRRGRVHQAELYGEAAFSGYREAGARTGMAHAACLLGDVARARGAHAAARERYQEGWRCSTPRGLRPGPGAVQPGADVAGGG